MNAIEDWLGTGLVATFAATALVLIVAAVAYVALRRVLLPLVARLASYTAFRWDDVLVDRSLQRWLALLAPAVLIHLAVPLIPGLSDFWSGFWDRVTAAAVIFVATLTITSLMMAFNTVYETGSWLLQLPHAGESHVSPHQLRHLGKGRPRGTPFPSVVAWLVTNR